MLDGRYPPDAFSEVGPGRVGYMAPGVVGDIMSPSNDGGELPDALDMVLDGGVNAGLPS